MKAVVYTHAVQLAKLYGTEVIGVDNAGKLDFMRSPGADQVIGGFLPAGEKRLKSLLGG